MARQLAAGSDKLPTEYRMLPPHKLLEDSEIIERVIANDDTAFVELHDRYYRLAYGTAFSVLMAPAEADSVAAETFVAIAQASSRLDPTRPFANFVATIARRKALTLWRQVQHRNHHEIQILDADEHQDSSEIIPDKGLLPEDLAVAAERRASLLLAIARLPPDQALVLDALFFGGLTLDELAQLLNRSKGAIKALRDRGLTQLRKDPSRYDS